jgi:hypothetical protein
MKQDEVSAAQALQNEVDLMIKILFGVTAIVGLSMKNGLCHPTLLIPLAAFTWALEAAFLHAFRSYSLIAHQFDLHCFSIDIADSEVRRLTANAIMAFALSFFVVAVELGSKHWRGGNG